MQLFMLAQREGVDSQTVLATANLPTSSSGVAVWSSSLDPWLGAELGSGEKSRKGDTEEASRDWTDAALAPSGGGRLLLMAPGELSS